jgi:hypothetical protein
MCKASRPYNVNGTTVLNKRGKHRTSRPGSRSQAGIRTERESNVVAVPFRSTNEVRAFNAVGGRFVLHQTAGWALIFRKASLALSTHLPHYSHSGPVTL